MIDSRIVGKFTVKLQALVFSLAILGGCTDSFFGSEPNRPVENKTPPIEAPKETKVEVVNKNVLLELAVAPAEAWWNNCVEILYKEKTIDVGCAKTKGGLRPVNLEVGKDETCVAIAVRVNTFKNVGPTCSQRFAKGLPCEGPYSNVPDMVRTSSKAGESGNFKWEQNAANGESKLRFEDQTSENLAATNADPAKAEEFGIDFNDIVLTLRPAGVQLVVMTANAGGLAANGKTSSVCGQ